MSIPKPPRRAGLIAAAALLAAPAAAQRRRRNAHEWLLDSADAARFADLVALAGAEAEFAAPGPLSFFIPHNAAIEAMDPASLNPLRADRALLRRMLRHHIGEFSGAIASAGSAESGETASFRSKLGQTLLLNTGAGLPRINGVPILTANIAATNGLLHLIDGVLLPL